MPNAGSARPKPFTVDHFLRWARLLVLDNGRQWEPEEFQLDFVAEVCAGYREILALWPTGSYKTTTCAGLALYHCAFTADAAVPIGAAAGHQAAILYEQAAGFVRRTPGLHKRFRVQGGYRHIRCLSTGGLIRVYSASDDTGDGIIPTLGFLDELHRHKNNLHGTWRDKLTKRDGQLAILSTAGDDESNPVEQLREAAHRLPDVTRRGRRTIARSAGREFVMHEYALRQGDDVTDLELVKQANPASQVTLEELRMRRDSPSTKRWQWLRFTCNLPTKGEESAVEPEDWDALAEEGLTVAPEAPVYGYLDLAWKIDTTGLGVLAWEARDRRVITDTQAIQPPVDEADIVVALLRMQERHGDALRGVVFDPNAGGTQMAQLLRKGEHPLQVDDTARSRKGLPPLGGRAVSPLRFIEHSQDNAPMALAASRLDEAIRNRWLRHDGDPVLRRHVLNAVSKPVGGEKWRYDRPPTKHGEARAKWPIDLLTGLLMGHSQAVAEHDVDPVVIDPAAYRIEAL